MPRTYNVVVFLRTLPVDESINSKNRINKIMIYNNHLTSTGCYSCYLCNFDYKFLS